MSPLSVIMWARVPSRIIDCYDSNARITDSRHLPNSTPVSTSGCPFLLSFFIFCYGDHIPEAPVL